MGYIHIASMQFSNVPFFFTKLWNAWFNFKYCNHHTHPPPLCLNIKVNSNNIHCQAYSFPILSNPSSPKYNSIPSVPFMRVCQSQRLHSSVSISGCMQLSLSAMKVLTIVQAVLEAHTCTYTYACPHNSHTHLTFQASFVQSPNRTIYSLFAQQDSRHNPSLSSHIKPLIIISSAVFLNLHSCSWNTRDSQPVLRTQLIDHGKWLTWSGWVPDWNALLASASWSL